MESVKKLFKKFRDRFIERSNFPLGLKMPSRIRDLTKMQCVIREFLKCLVGIQDLSAQSESGIRQTGKEKTIFGVVEINEVQDAALSWNKGGNAGSELPPLSLPDPVPKIITCLLPVLADLFPYLSDLGAQVLHFYGFECLNWKQKKSLCT